MISIGNDIVDLAAIDKQRTQQKAFYSKILSDTEQQLYSRYPQLPFEIYVWLLWSAKESVYKFAKRLNPELVFSPVRIEVDSEPILEPEFSESNFQNVVLEGITSDFPTLKFGEFLNSVDSSSDNILAYNYHITYKSNIYYLQSLISNTFIATTASDSPDFSKVNWGIKHIEQTDYGTQSQTVKEFVIEKLKETYPNNKISIAKSVVGYPVVLNDSAELNIPLSFAHHGHYVSYAFAY
jgi:phosphopantetheine--protein transferase-like protein